MLFAKVFSKFYVNFACFARAAILVAFDYLSTSRPILVSRPTGGKFKGCIRRGILFADKKDSMEINLKPTYDWINK